MNSEDSRENQDGLEKICARITMLRKSLTGIEGEVLKVADPQSYLEKQADLAQLEMARFCLVYGNTAHFP